MVVRLLLVGLVFCCAVVHASTIVRNQYIVFEDRVEFESYLQTSMPEFYGKLVDHSDLRYQRGETILQNVWTAYQKLFPANTDQLPTPFLVILKGVPVDAFVTGDPVTHLLPNAFFVMEKVLERPDAEIAGLMGHELTHLLTPEFKDVFYRVDNGEEPLGFLQTNDAAVEKTFLDWHAITDVVGPFNIPELQGLPAPVVYDGKLFNIIPAMTKKWGEESNPSCKVIREPFPSWRLDLMLKYISMLNQKLIMTAADKKKLSQQVSDYIADLRSCLGSQSGQLIPILLEMLHQPEAELQKKYGEIARIFDQQPNVVDGLFAVTDFLYKKLDEFANTHDLSSYRIYSSEEIADDNSIRVLNETEYSATGIADFFLSYMEDAQPGSKAECLSLISSGQVPSYGLITDIHHSACYRIYHVKQFYNWLQIN